MLSRCARCKLRYGLGPVCELCLEREHWRDVDRVGWKTWAGIGLALVYAIAVGLLVPLLLIRK